MCRKLTALVTALSILIASLFGLLITLTAFAGHPPEWILDAYYSIFPETAVGGVLILFAGIGLLSAVLFGVALVLIFRRAPS
jgi:hypothetical protein